VGGRKMFKQGEDVSGSPKEQLLYQNVGKGTMITVRHSGGMTNAYIVRKSLGNIGLRDIVIEFGANVHDMNNAEEIVKILEEGNVYTSKYPPNLS
jgi:hypothetical protein